jgi:hypothetical protein
VPEDDALVFTEEQPLQTVPELVGYPSEAERNAISVWASSSGE